MHPKAYPRTIEVQVFCSSRWWRRGVQNVTGVVRTYLWTTRGCTREPEPFTTRVGKKMCSGGDRIDGLLS